MDRSAALQFESCWRILETSSEQSRNIRTFILDCSCLHSDLDLTGPLIICSVDRTHPSATGSVLNDVQSSGAAGRNHSPASEPLTGNGAVPEELQCNWPMWFPRSAETCWSKHLVNSLIGLSSPEKTLHRSWNQKNKTWQKLWPSSACDPVLCSFHVVVSRWWWSGATTSVQLEDLFSQWRREKSFTSHSDTLVGPFPPVFKVTRTSYSTQKVRTTSIHDQNSYFSLNKHVFWL